MTAPNPHVTAVAPPPIPAARLWAKAYDGALGPAVDLTQAVPGYPAHPDMIARIAAASVDPESFAYGHITGDRALRDAYAADVNGLYGADIEADEVAITTGANMGSFAVTMALARAGDAVMLPVPWYFNHQMNAAMLGIGVVPLPCRPEDGFVPDPDRAEALLDDKVRAILLVTPNNPTGAIYPPAVLEGFAALCRRRRITLVIDETYRDFRPATLARPHELLADPAWRETIVQIYSFSKSYCIPGYRAGAIVAGPALMAELTKILDCLQICAPRVGQAALAWAIPALVAWRESNRTLMNDRGAAADRAFSGLPGWRIDSRGAYFAYARHPYPGHSALDVAKALAEQRGVTALPGSVFGRDQENHLRLAFANVDAATVADVARRLITPLQF